MAREARGESRADVAQALKLSLRQVEALEQGEYDSLPGPAFVRGFMRNYARHLGIDAEPLLGSLGGGAVTAPVELAPVSNAEGDMPAGRGSRNVTGPAATVALFLAFAVLAGWYFDWFRTEPPVVLSEDSRGMAEAPVQGDVAVEPEPAAAAPEAGGATATAPAVVQEAPPAATPPAVPAPAAAADAPAAAVQAATAAPQLLFRFAGESWIEVRDASGAVVYSGLGAAGSSRSVQGKPPFTLVVGNAKDVRVEFNGREVDLQPHTRVAVARLTVQ